VSTSGLGTRTTVGQAEDLVMARSGVRPGWAIQMLQRVSSVPVRAGHRSPGWRAVPQELLMRQQSIAPRRASLTNGASPSIHRFCRDPGVPMVDFARGQRKDDIARDYFAGFEAEGHTEGVLFVGRAQEKTPSGQGGEDFRGRTGVWAWLSDHPRHREVQAPARYSGGEGQSDGLLLWSFAGTVCAARTSRAASYRSGGVVPEMRPPSRPRGRCGRRRRRHAGHRLTGSVCRTWPGPVGSVPGHLGLAPELPRGGPDPPHSWLHGYAKPPPRRMILAGEGGSLERLAVTPPR
jgi:hypothetical protein